MKLLRGHNVQNRHRERRRVWRPGTEDHNLRLCADGLTDGQCDRNRVPLRVDFEYRFEVRVAESLVGYAQIPAHGPEDGYQLAVLDLPVGSGMSEIPNGTYNPRVVMEQHQRDSAPWKKRLR